MDWAKIIADEARTSALIRSDALAPKTGVGIQSLRVLLKRQERRGLVERAARKLYVNKLAAGFNPRDVAALVAPESYVSLESALNDSPRPLETVAGRWRGA